MIVVSDDDDEVEETNRTGKMRKYKNRRAMPGSDLTENRNFKSDETDEVCVVGEVLGSSKKLPKGCVIAPPGTHELVHHSSIIRRRKRPETNSVTKYATIRRGVNTYPSFRGIHPNILKRKLYQKDEVVRLDERRKYLAIIKYVIGAGMVIAAHNFMRNAIQTYFAPLRSFQSLEASQTCQPPQTSSPQRSAEKRLSPAIECVDLTTDSENEIEEIPKKMVSSEGPCDDDDDDDDDDDGDDDVKEVPTDSNDDNDVVDLDSEPETTCLLHEKEQDVECISSSSEHSEPLAAEDSDDLCITVEDEINPTSNITVPHSTKNKSKSNLEEQMLQQMIIHDDSENVIDVEGDKYNKRPDDNEDGNVGDNIDDLEESLPEITREMQILIHRAFRCTTGKVLVEGFGLTIHTNDLHTLKGMNWLNDQVINLYMYLLMERGKLSSYPSVYCFNTFFYVKLLKSGHSSLKRWTRMVDIFSYDLLIVPVHLKVHWCLACVNFIEKRIEYYDSMGDKNDECGRVLLQYLEYERLDKKSEIFNTSGWEIVNMEDIPEQLNGSDCGVFLCTYAEYICRLAKLTFTQRDMPYFRVKMAYEILTKKLLL